MVISTRIVLFTQEAVAYAQGISTVNCLAESGHGKAECTMRWVCAPAVEEERSAAKIAGHTHKRNRFLYCLIVKNSRLNGRADAQ